MNLPERSIPELASEIRRIIKITVGTERFKTYRLTLLRNRKDYPIPGAVAVHLATFDAKGEDSASQCIFVHSRFEAEDVRESNSLFLIEGAEPRILSHRLSLPEPLDEQIYGLIDKISNKGESASAPKLLAFRELLDYIAPTN